MATMITAVRMAGATKERFGLDEIKKEGLESLS
jgi:hypothetical protein